MNNDFCIKIVEVSDKSYKILELLKNGTQIPPEVTKNEIDNSIAELEKGFYSLYKRYTSNLLIELMALEKAYLCMKGVNLEISITVKLLDKVYLSGDSNINLHSVYTAFRDKETFNKGEREIGVIKYEINKNSDFLQCLTSDQFVINNINPDTQNYINQHKEYSKYYNCTVVVPIRLKLADDSFKYYGYLCCECLNDDKNVEVFDTNSAKYLFIFSKTYATYLATLEANWSDRISNYRAYNINYDKEFLEVIFKKTFK